MNYDCTRGTVDAPLPGAGEGLVGHVECQQGKPRDLNQTVEEEPEEGHDLAPGQQGGVLIGRLHVVLLLH